MLIVKLVKLDVALWMFWMYKTTHIEELKLIYFTRQNFVPSSKTSQKLSYVEAKEL